MKWWFNYGYKSSEDQTCVFNLINMSRSGGKVMNIFYEKGNVYAIHHRLILFYSPKCGTVEIIHSNMVLALTLKNKPSFFLPCSFFFASLIKLSEYLYMKLYVQFCNLICSSGMLDRIKLLQKIPSTALFQRK